MTPEEIAANEAATAAAKEAEAKALADKAKAEADAQALHKQKTEKEKAEYSLRKNAERLKTLGGDPTSVLGIKLEPSEDEPDDDTPLTVGKLKEMQRQNAQQTAMQLADAIEDDAERKEVKDLLEKRITPSGNAEADLALARAGANARKNALLAEEAARRSKPNRTAAGGSMPGKPDEAFEPTAEETVFMQNYGLTKEDVIKARAQTAAKSGK